jgi:hypothetical protein
LIEASIGKELKKPWYVDGRLATRVKTDATAIRRAVAMLPKGKNRNVYAYSSYLWNAVPPEVTV